MLINLYMIWLQVLSPRSIPLSPQPTTSHPYWSPCLCACLAASVMSNSLWPYRLWATRFLWPWDSPGKNTGVGCHFLLQGIFPTQGLNLHLLHCRWILYHWATRDAQEIWGNESYCSDWSLIPAYGVWPEGWRMLHGRTAASAETRFEVRGSISFQKEEGAIVDRRVVWEQKNKETNQASTTTI